MVYFFLKEDYIELSRRIDELNEKIRAISLEMGKWAQEDRGIFTYEEGERQKYMWSTRLRELIKIKNNSEVVEPTTRNDKVSLGKYITFRDEITGEIQSYKIGSYMVLTPDNNTISYDTSLAQFLIDARIDERIEGEVAGRRRVLCIVKIE